ncbi:hypothetical protein GCM10029976_090640 [Kribbella albertanoniae]|nr:hypothetical protein [Kribbella albertanoniae]
MYAPPTNLTEVERDELIERCPEQQRGLFTDWLDGKRDLAGDLLEEAA